MKKTVVPSIIAKNQEDLDEKLKRIKFTKRIHLDVMDGRFVANHSLDFNFELPKKKFYEAHLMIAKPIPWIREHGKKTDLIIIHRESVETPEKAIEEVKKIKRKVGLAINPDTHLWRIQPYIKKVHHILQMTVYPGKYGSSFIPETLDNVAALRSLTKKDIEIDGGMSLKTIKLAKKAGANIFVSGSYIMKHRTPKIAWQALKRALR